MRLVQWASVSQARSVHACGAHRQSRPSSSAGYVSNNQKKKQHVGRCVPTPGFRTRAFAELCRWSKSRQSRGLCSESPVPTAQYNTVVPMIVKRFARVLSHDSGGRSLSSPPSHLSHILFSHTCKRAHTKHTTPQGRGNTRLSDICTDKSPSAVSPEIPTTGDGFSMGRV